MLGACERLRRKKRPGFAASGVPHDRIMLMEGASD